MNALSLFVVLQMLILVVLDLVVPHKNSLGVVGVTYWSLLWLTLFVYTGYALTRLSHTLIQSRMWITTIVALLYLGTFIVSLPDARHLSGESTREISCVIAHLTNTKDMGFSSVCHLGYPARQFYIPAVPTMLFGRSLVALQTGSLLYFIAGFIVFVRGLVIANKRHKHADLTGGVILTTLFHFHMATYIVLTFEQAVYPMSFAMFTVGLWLTWLHERSTVVLLLLGLIQLILIHSYTPALAVMALNLLLFLVFAYEAYRQKSKRWVLFIVIFFVSCLSLWVSVQTRSDIRILTTKTPITFEMVFTTLGETWRHIVYKSGTIPWTSPMFTLPFVGTLALGLLGVFGLPISVITLWILSVIAVAVISNGYASGSVDYKLQRATVMIPYFLALLTEISKYIRVPKKILIVIIFLFSITGIGTFMDIRSKKQDMHQVMLARFLAPHIPTSEQKGIWVGTIFIASDVSPYIKADNFEDAALYFLPGWHGKMKHLPEKEEGGCRLEKGIWVIPSSHPCSRSLQSSGRAKRWDTGWFPEIKDKTKGIAVDLLSIEYP